MANRKSETINEECPQCHKYFSYALSRFELSKLGPHGINICPRCPRCQTIVRLNVVRYGDMINVMPCYEQNYFSEKPKWSVYNRR